MTSKRSVCLRGLSIVSLNLVEKRICTSEAKKGAEYFEKNGAGSSRRDSRKESGCSGREDMEEECPMDSPSHEYSEEQK